ncbi:hemerythrin domain-containing protein [Nakamurella sp.]|uniref:hemerythrin domain-containing protein n=1 Tax=Nakamurella sp. TaxID=1869182 RepID=UPI00378437B4
MESARVVAWSTELRRVHQRLADALVIARESVEAGGPVALALEPLTYCWAFCAALDGHHGGEDHWLFPAVRAARPDLAVVLDDLARDHRMIGHLLGELRRAMTAGAGVDELRRHLDGIEAVMTTHFRYEEKRLLAVVDQVGLSDVDTTVVFGPLG